MKKILNLFVIASCLLLLSSCSNENKEKLIGKWSETYTLEGYEWNLTYEFNKNGEFTQTLTPRSSVGIGFSVPGTWEIDYSGDLRLKYSISHFAPLLGSEVSFNDPAVAEVVEDAQETMIENNRENWYYKLEFINNDRLKIISSDDEDIFDRVNN